MPPINRTCRPNPTRPALPAPLARLALPAPVAPSPKDPLDLPSQLAHPALHRSRDALFDRAAVQRAEIRRDVVAVLEVFRVDRTAVDRSRVRDLAERLFVKAGGAFELHRCPPSRGAAHEVHP